MKQTISLSLLLTLFSSACSDGKSGNTKDTLANTPGTTLTVPEKDIPAVTPATSPLSLEFAAKVNGEDLKCNDKSPEMLAAGQVFTDVRIFLSNIALVNDAGEEIRIALDVEQDSKNLQFIDANSQSISLLNFLDASCASSDATQTLKNVISGSLPPGKYTALKFQVGLPYEATANDLTKIPAALAPSDMAWMWEHYPADFQIEMSDGTMKKTFNSLISSSTQKPSITLTLDYTHEQDAVAPKVELELSKLFLTSGEAFVAGLDSTCLNKTNIMTESNANCAHAFKAFGLEVANPKEAYSQSLFSIVP